MRAAFLWVMMASATLLLPARVWAFMATSFGSDHVVYIEPEGWYSGSLEDILWPKRLDLDGDGNWDASIQNSMWSYGGPEEGYMGSGVSIKDNVWVYGFDETTGSHETGDLFSLGCVSPFAAGDVLPRVEDDPTRWWGKNPSALDARITITGLEEIFGMAYYFNTGLDAYKSYYIGLALEKPEGFYYAWVEVYNGGRALIHVKNYAYETEPNKTLVFGAIPEPATAALITMGCIFLALKRKKR